MRKAILVMVGALAVGGAAEAGADDRLRLQASGGTDPALEARHLAGAAELVLVRHVSLFGEAEWEHRPARLRDHAGGSYSHSGGGDTRYLAGGLKLTILPDRRLSPYLVAGRGRATFVRQASRGFGAVDATGDFVFYGAGLRYQAHEHVALQLEGRVGGAAIGDGSIYVPLRVGVSFGF
jgi:hypothetical protein